MDTDTLLGVGKDRPRGDLDRQTVAEAADAERFEAARNIISSGRGIAKNPYAASGSRPDVRRMGTHDHGWQEGYGQWPGAVVPEQTPAAVVGG
jgi:hypothetical protein